jgi:ABC-type bacteriocin/lantibiotic exporter with double-glycine peptidase domain
LSTVKNSAILALCLAAADISGWPQQPSSWIDVPFIRQPAEGCGAASVAMVMQYWQEQAHKKPDQTSNVSTIQSALHSEGVHGIYASDLQRYLNRQGYETYVFRGDETLLQHHLEKGRPLIVAIKPGSGPLLHYVVVAGVDPANHLLMVNDPAQRKLLKVESEQFEKEWQSTGNWTLLAVPRLGPQ